MGRGLLNMGRGLLNMGRGLLNMGRGLLNRGGNSLSNRGGRGLSSRGRGSLLGGIRLLSEHFPRDAGVLERELEHRERGTRGGPSGSVECRDIKLLLHRQAELASIDGLHADAHLLTHAHNRLDGGDNTLR